MFTGLISFSLITSVALTGSTLQTPILPNTEVSIPIKKKGEKRETIKKTRPIIQDWKTRLKNKDTQIDTFVSKSISLSDKNYEPTDLVSVGGVNEIGEAGRVNKIRKVARESLWNMARDFHITFWEPLIVISAYRSAAYQKRMWDLGKCTDSLCAPPGHSEHQLWIAVDLFDATTEEEYYKNPKYVAYIKWLQRYAHLYGWTQSYQKWEDIDEYEIEPWHWRYVWVELATKLKKLDMTLTEYNRLQYVMDWR